MSQINVTPFVDVMLVLLVVFMITAPLLTVGVPVDLPKTEASQVLGQDEPLIVTVNAQDEVFLQDTKIELAQLVPRLVAITRNRKDIRVFIRGDQSLEYGSVMRVMGAVHQAGYTRVALITDLPGRLRPAGEKAR